MLNASVGVQRVLGRLRRPHRRPASPSRGLRSRSRAFATRIDRGLHAAIVGVHLDYGALGKNEGMMMVSVSGTAVTLE